MGPVLPVWVSPLLALLFVATAAALAVYVSVPILRQPAGPTLPERLHRWRGQHRFATAVAFAPLAVAGATALWAMPLAWLLLQAVSHRVRRRVFGDTWSLGGQIAWNLRVIVAGMGFWWAVSLAPLALVAAGGPLWLVAAVGAVLLAWNHFYCDILLLLLGARTLADRPELTAAFTPVLGRATIPPPRLLHAGPRGARVANAFALSAVRGDAVLFLDALLEQATPAESAGVLAHEIGHLEDFAPRRGRFYAHGVLLALGATLVTLAARLAEDTVPKAVVLVWFGVAIGSLIARGIRSQARETASDRRAVELCGGDGEALVRALLLLYQTAQMPRRLAPEEERRATHPGLGRRIRAIRAASGLPPPLVEPRAVAGDGVPRAVIFEATRLVFVSLGESPDLADLAGLVQRAHQVDAIAYTELSELRIEAGRQLPAVLVAADRAGTRRRLRIALDDVPAVQALMDRVDQWMAPPAPAPSRRLAPLFARLTSLLALIVLLLSAPSMGVVGAALLACIRPATTLLAGLAAGALATIVLPGAPPSPTRMLMLVLTALACLTAVALEARAERSQPRPFQWDGFLWLQAIVIGGGALFFAVVVLALGSTDVARLHVVARSVPSAAAAWAVLGGFLLPIPRRLARLGSAAAFAIAAITVGLGSDAFRARYAPDPLIAAAPLLVVDDLRAPVVRRLTLSGSHWTLQLSPDARHLVAATTPAGYGATIRYDVAGFDGWQRSIDAQDVAFLDADTLFVVRTDGPARVLSTEGLRDGVARWSLRLDDAGPGGVEVDGTGRWRIVQLDAGADGTRVRLEGRIGETTGHPPAATRLAVERRWTGGRNPFAWLVPELWATTTLARASGAAPRTSIARTRLAVDCRGTPLAPAILTCLARTSDETYVWHLDVEHARLTPVARTPALLTATASDAGVIVVWRGGEILALWRDVPRAVRLARAGDSCPCPYEASYANGHLATMARDGERTTIALHAMPAPRQH